MLRNGISSDEAQSDQWNRLLEVTKAQGAMGSGTFAPIAKNGGALHCITWNIKKSELPFEPEDKDSIVLSEIICNFAT